MTAWSDRQLVKLKYSAYMLANNTGPQLRVFRGNDMYDPDFTGVGHQPYGFDQWCAMYSKFVVFASKMKVFAQPNSAQAIMAIRASNSSTAPTDDQIGEMMERPNIVTRMYNAAGGNFKPISMFRKTKAMLAPCNPKYDDLFWGTSSAVPNSQWYWHVIAQHPNPASTVDVNYNVVITYYAMFFNRVQADTS